MENFILQILPELQDKTEEYIKSIGQLYNQYIKNSELPARYLYTVDKVCRDYRGVSNLVHNMDEFVKERYSSILNFCDFKDTGRISSSLINSYFRQAVLNDDILQNVLYIDTPLLMEDYKRLISYNNEELSHQLVHSKETLYKNVENYELVIWDKFNNIKSQFDLDKLYTILSIRYRKDLSNLYMIRDGSTGLLKVITLNIFDVMGTSDVEDCYKLDGGGYNG